MVFAPHEHPAAGGTMLAASAFEFKSRLWIFGAIFGVAFFSYSLDHQNAGAAVVDWIARTDAACPRAAQRYFTVCELGARAYNSAYPTTRRFCE
jgi:hypothetical protein